MTHLSRLAWSSASHFSFAEKQWKYRAENSSTRYFLHLMTCRCLANRLNRLTCELSRWQSFYATYEHFSAFRTLRLSKAKQFGGKLFTFRQLKKIIAWWINLTPVVVWPANWRFLVHVRTDENIFKQSTKHEANLQFSRFRHTVTRRWSLMMQTVRRLNLSNNINRRSWGAIEALLISR